MTREEIKAQVLAFCARHNLTHHSLRFYATQGFTGFACEDLCNVDPHDARFVVILGAKPKLNTLRKLSGILANTLARGMQAKYLNGVICNFKVYADRGVDSAWHTIVGLETAIRKICGSNYKLHDCNHRPEVVRCLKEVSAGNLETKHRRVINRLLKALKAGE